MTNKKITILALTAFLAAFGAYKALIDLSKAFEDIDFEEEEEYEF
jgi:hypothetical protein